MAQEVYHRYYLDQNGDKHAYTIKDPIGEGGFGKVFSAHVRTELVASTELVAVKEIPIAYRPGDSAWKAEIKRFQKKVLPNLLSLSHVNVMRYYDAGSRDGLIEGPRVILVMEYCSGM